MRLHTVTYRHILVGHNQQANGGGDVYEGRNDQKDESDKRELRANLLIPAFPARVGWGGPRAGALVFQMMRGCKWRSQTASGKTRRS